MFKTNPATLRRFWLTAAALSGCVFQFGWIPTCRGALTTVNPCGTILNCLPEDIDLDLIVWISKQEGLVLYNRRRS